MMYRYYAPRFERRPSQPEADFFEEGPEGAQIVPVNVFETPDEVMVVAPMPGVEAENIEIMAHGNIVTIRADMRGEGQERKDYIRREWRYGPYYRRVDLPCEVDAEAANASHGNGVLTVALPKSKRSRAHRIQLSATGPAEGKHQGHTGHIAGGPSPKSH
ncbi:MAG: Hsp20/alpha crystallin family protein [Chloroflexi bacterium]|nr:Hsp20/alpha crystallin family protein [Chloroflexota bacterium]